MRYQSTNQTIFVNHIINKTKYYGIQDLLKYDSMDHFYIPFILEKLLSIFYIIDFMDNTFYKYIYWIHKDDFFLENEVKGIEKIVSSLENIIYKNIKKKLFFTFNIF